MRENRTTAMFSLEERNSASGPRSRARDTPKVLWVVWAIPTATLCAVVLYVNIENAHTAKQVETIWKAHNKKGSGDTSTKDKATFVLLAMTLVILAGHIAVSFCFLRYSYALFHTIDIVLQQFARFFRKVGQHKLNNAFVTVCDCKEVTGVSELNPLSSVLAFSRYKEVAAAQQEMSLAHLWLREYDRFILQGPPRGDDGQFDNNCGSATMNERTALSAQLRTRQENRQALTEEGVLPMTLSPVAGEEEEGRPHSKRARPFPQALGDQSALPNLQAADGSTPTGERASKVLKKRFATIVAAYYPQALVRQELDTGLRNTTVFMKVALKCCREAKGFVLPPQPHRVVMCWNAFTNQADHEQLGYDCLRSLGKELENLFTGESGLCSCAVAGVTGHVVAGYVRPHAGKRHRVILGDCVTLINEVGSLLHLQKSEGLPGCCAWLSPMGTRPAQRTNIHVPYDCVRTKDSGEYTVYHILDLEVSAASQPYLAIANNLGSAFDALRTQQYEKALKILQDVGSEAKYNEMAFDRHKHLSSHEKTLFSLWERLRFLNGIYNGTRLRYTRELPHWAQFASDTPAAASFPLQVKGEEPSGVPAAASIEASDGGVAHHHWRRGHHTLEAQLQQHIAVPPKLSNTRPTQDTSIPSALCEQGTTDAPADPLLTSSAETTPLPNLEDAGVGTAQVAPASRSLRSVPMAAIGDYDETRDFFDSSRMHFRLTDKKLGVTPTSRVVLGLSVDTGSLVAVKRIRFVPQNASALTKRRRARDGCLVANTFDTILAEVKTMAKLQSSKIVSYVTAVVFDKRNELFLVMEYVSGGSLHSIMHSHQGSRMPLWLARRYLREALESLKYLHAKGIVHCDIKPQNVLVPDVGPCKLSDFGISRTISEVSPTNRLNNGTRQYMAPEAFRGELTQKSDIFSFGVMLGEVVTGRPPAPQSGLVTPKACVEPQDLVDDLKFSEARGVFIACTQMTPEQRPTVEDVLSMAFFADKR